CVEAALNGQTAISEYTIGIEVFERRRDFEPRTDPIVRVHTRRLRSRLAQYYAKEGAGDPVEILLRRRSYIPSFLVRAPQPQRSHGIAASLAILPFVKHDLSAEQQAFVEGLTKAVTRELSNSEYYTVIASAGRSGGSPEDLREPIRQQGVQAVFR